MDSSNSSLLQSAFDQDGYLHLPGFFPPHEIRELKDQLEHFIRLIVPQMPADHAFYEDAADKSSLKQLFHMSDYDPYFQSLLRGSKMELLAEALLGEKMSKGFVEYFNKPPGIGKPTPPHQDAWYFMITPPQAITFWVPVEDTDEENGCLIYVRSSHRKGMRPHGRSQILGFSQGITDYGTADDLENEVAVPARVGDVLVHHGMTIHRADGNNSPNRSRRVMGFVYFGASAREDTEAKAAYQQILKQERAQAC
jgi:phytanoyl-CoA hydroxylase